MIVRDCNLGLVVTTSGGQTYGALQVQLASGGDFCCGDITVVAATTDLASAYAFFGRFQARNDGGIVFGPVWPDFGSAGVHTDLGFGSPYVSIVDATQIAEIGIYTDTVLTGFGWCFCTRMTTEDASGVVSLGSPRAVVRRRFGEVTTTDSSTWVDVVMDDTAAAEMSLGSDTVAAYRIQWSARDTNDRSAGLWFVTAKNAGGTITIVGDTPSDTQSCPYDNPTAAWDPSTHLRAQTTAGGIKLQVKGFSGSSMAWQVRVEQEVQYRPPSAITTAGSGLGDGATGVGSRPKGQWTER